MSVPRSRKRSLLRTAADAMVFVLFLAMVVLVARQAGVFAPESGNFSAIDGDSLRKGADEYRLHAIDAPELHQTCQTDSGRTYACGRDALEALRRQVANKTLDCRILDTDRYGRLVVACSSGGIDINAEMVRQGWALAYRQHGLDYAGIEDEARQAKRGVWQGRFEHPEQWRAAHRNQLVRGGLSDENPPD